MHEVSLANDLIELLKRELDKQRQLGVEIEKIKSVQVSIGEISCASPDNFRFAFEAVKTGTQFAETELEIKHEALVINCLECGFEGEAKDSLPLCPNCSSGSTEILSGSDFLLKSIEIEER